MDAYKRSMQNTLKESGHKVKGGGNGEDFPPFWNFYDRETEDGIKTKAQGSYIEGEITDIREQDDKYGHKIPVLSIKIENGAIYTVWASQTTLRNKINAADIDVGKSIGIEYKGKAKNPKSGRTYMDFDVFVA